MISMMMFLLSLFAGKQIQQPQIDAMHHDVQTVAALADGMVYYQSQAIQKCWQGGASSCAAGSVDLANRTGAQTASGYGSGYETVTDGSTYIATTLDTQGAVAGRTHQESTVNSGVFAALKGMTSQSSAVGYYDQTAGGVILPDKNNEVVSVRFASTPVQGQPVIYSTIATAPPPVQLASIAGGGYSPLVPIPPTVTPSPTSPAAVVSPPASVSPPEPTSPTYTPPATIVINPISPWAPSPVPPPPPPPPPPVPPPPPPPPPAPSPQYANLAVGWGCEPIDMMGRDGVARCISYNYPAGGGIYLLTVLVTMKDNTQRIVAKDCFVYSGGNYDTTTWRARAVWPSDRLYYVTSVGRGGYDNNIWDAFAPANFSRTTGANVTAGTDSECQSYMNALHDLMPNGMWKPTWPSGMQYRQYFYAQQRDSTNSVIGHNAEGNNLVGRSDVPQQFFDDLRGFDSLVSY